MIISINLDRFVPNTVIFPLHPSTFCFRSRLESIRVYFGDKRRSLDRATWESAAPNAWNWKEHCTSDEQTRPGHVERVVVAARYVEQPAWNTHVHAIPTHTHTHCCNNDYIRDARTQWTAVTVCGALVACWRVLHSFRLHTVYSGPSSVLNT